MIIWLTMTTSSTTVVESLCPRLCQPPPLNKRRQHYRLTICMELDELTNSIRQQDPKIYSYTEARCLVLQ